VAIEMVIVVGAGRWCESLSRTSSSRCCCWQPRQAGVRMGKRGCRGGGGRMRVSGSVTGTEIAVMCGVQFTAGVVWR
jgi:hypothetical protein